MLESVLFPIVSKINEYLSNYILIFLLVGVGLWYSIKTRQHMAEKAYVCQRVGQRGPVHGEILRRGGTVGPVAQQQGDQAQQGEG